MKKEIIFSKEAPPARPGRAQAVRFGDLVFLSGQVARDAADQFVGGDIQNQTRQVIENIRTVLEASGSGLDRVLKMTIFLNDIGDYDAMNEVFYEYFLDHPLARTCTQSGGILPPYGIEIEVIAAVIGPDDRLQA